MDKRFDSLSFPFQYTRQVYRLHRRRGTTVTALAKGADTFVSELIDEQVAGSMVAPINGTDAENKRFQVMKPDVGTHHLTPEQIGKMASEAKVGRVVITHLVPSRKPGMSQHDSYVAEIFTSRTAALLEFATVSEPLLTC